MNNTNRIDELEVQVGSLKKILKRHECSHVDFTVKFWNWKGLSRDATCNNCGKRLRRGAITKPKIEKIIKQVYDMYT